MAGFSGKVGLGSDFFGRDQLKPGHALEMIGIASEQWQVMR